VDLNEYINSKARMEGDDIVGVEPWSNQYFKIAKMVF
jgi:hypothetical protein